MSLMPASEGTRAVARRGLKTTDLHSRPVRARGFRPKPAAWPTLRPYQVSAGRAIIDSALDGQCLTMSAALAVEAAKDIETRPRIARGRLAER